MKNRIILHTEPKKAVITSLAFILISLLIMLTFVLSINKDVIRLNFLVHSKYDYSATMQDTILKDDYYKFNASIEFALSTDAQIGLNADIIMQSQDSEYTDIIYWKADTISSKGIAISKNLAKRYGLNLGDKLYSKHIVNGENCEYSIEQILPEAVNVRESESISHSDGIIIMGYDEQYIENITYSSIVFTKNSINELSESGSPKNIVYREDEIIASLKNIIPYLIVLCIVSILITMILVSLLNKYVSYNFKRLVMLGFDKKKMNKAYYRLVYSVGFISIIVSLALSCTVFIYINFSVMKLLSMMLIMLIEIITLLITSCISNKKLWRK